jgi:FMN reductase
MSAIRIVGLGGGMRPTSRSLVALKEALSLVAAQGAETRLLSVLDLQLPIYRPDYDSPARYGPEAAPAIERLLESVRWADGMLWASPSYHGSLSGAVKNALDYIQFLSNDSPSFLYGKTVGMIATGSGAIAAVNTITQLNQIAHALRAQVVPLAVPITGVGRAIEDGALVDPQFRQRLEMLAKELVALVGQSGGKPRS